MKKLIVVNNPKNWKLHVPGIEITSAQAYLVSNRYHSERNMRVFNLCRDYSYQSKGYYVSLMFLTPGMTLWPRASARRDT